MSEPTGGTIGGQGLGERRQRNRKPGRPRKDIDAKGVEKLAALGCTYEEIGHIVGCDKAQISRRFATEITKGRAELRMSLRRKQIELAKNGNVTMLIWLGKQYLEQSDKQAIETSGKTELRVAGRSPEEFDQETVRLILEKVEARRQLRLAAKAIGSPVRCPVDTTSASARS